MERIMGSARKDRNVLAGHGVDAFEGPAVGVEVPEIAGHGGGEALIRIPGAGHGQQTPSMP